MANGNFNPFGQGSWPEDKSKESPPIGTGEGESPMTSPGAPKMPEVDVRTYGSDVRSMAESGGGPPKPYQPAAPTPPTSSPVPQEEKKSFSEVFEAPGGAGMPPTPVNVPPAGLQEFGAAPKSKKGLFALILGIIIVVGLGAIGYFYVYPTFFGGPAVVETPGAPPVVEAPPAEPPVVPQVPVVETPEVPATSTEEGTSTEGAAPSEGAVVPGTQLLEHKSLLKTAADVSTNITLEAVSLGSIKSQLEFLTAQVPVLKEVVFKNSDGTIVTAQDIMRVLLPDIPALALDSNFEMDFTFLTFTNDKGTWPAVVLKLSGDASLADTKTAVQKIETGTSLANLFLADPGTAGAWKSGTTEGVSNRYSTYTLAGAGLNYGWFSDTLVIGTSYAGFQEALKRLK